MWYRTNCHHVKHWRPYNQRSFQQTNWRTWSTRTQCLQPLLESGRTTNLPPGGDHLISSPHLSVQDNQWPTYYNIQLKRTLTPFCSKMVFVMEKLWLAQTSRNKAPLRFSSGRPFFLLNHSRIPPTWVLESPSRTMKYQVFLLNYIVILKLKTTGDM